MADRVIPDIRSNGVTKPEDVRMVCWRWQEVLDDGRMTFSCVCAGVGCPDDPRLGLLERWRVARRRG